MPEYTVFAVLAVVAVVTYELRRTRTGIFRSSTYWITMAIVVVFQCIVDGWLTRLDDPIVRYDSQQLSGVRFPWDIPIEDFLFGFALLTWVLIRWRGAERTTPGQRDGGRTGRPEKDAVR